MEVIRDEKRVARLRQISQYTNLVGMLALIGGLVLIFVGGENVIVFQLIALIVGWILSQVGIFMSHRYVRKPRPDEVLDTALRPVARDGRLYHWVLPAPHVLLTPDGVVVLVPKYQIGEIAADGDKWTQRGIGMRRYFGQEGLGNPTKEAEAMVAALAKFIDENAPEVEEVPVAPLIVFTTKNIKSLDVANSRLPAMHYTKVKGFFRRQKGKTAAMPQEIYQALREAFDEKAGDLLLEVDGESA